MFQGYYKHFFKDTRYYNVGVRFPICLILVNNCRTYKVNVKIRERSFTLMPRIEDRVELKLP